MSARPPQGRRPGSTPRQPDSARQDQIVAALAPVVQGVGLELEDVEVRAVGRRLVLRVLVDSDHGVTLDEVATASTAVAEALEHTDVLGDEPYTLEVSSPGVDRPLTLPRHWVRSLGRLVAVTRSGGPALTGRITSVTDTEVDLEVDEKGRKRHVVIPLADITRAVVQVEFSRSAPEQSDAADLDADLDAADLDAADDVVTDDDADDPEGDDTDTDHHED